MAERKRPTLDASGTYIQPDPSGGLTQFESGEAEQGVRPTKWGAFIEAIKLGSLDSPTGIPFSGLEGAGIRAWVQSQMESDARRAGTSKLSPEEANRQYPGLSKPFTEPVYPAVADLIASDVKRKEAMRAWIDRGPGLGTVPGLIASGIAEGLDPFNLAVGVATGGASAALGIGGRGATALARVYGENVVGNLAGSALTYSQRRREGEDVTLGGELASAGVGAAIGTGIHVGVSSAIRGTSALLGRAESVAARMSPGAQERNLRAAIAQHESGVRTDLSPAVREAEMRMSGAVQPGREGAVYQFDPEAKPSGRSFFIAREAASGAPVDFGDFGAVGLYAVDHAQVANNLASAPDTPFTGRLREVQIPEDAKLLDLEAHIDADPMAKTFVEALEGRLGQKLDLPEGATLKQALAEVRSTFVEGPEGRRPAIREAADLARSQGFEGYRYVDSTTSQPHHGVVLFDEARAIPGEEWTANNDLAPRMSPEEAASMSDLESLPERSRTYEPDLDARIARLQAEPAAGAKPDYLDAVLQEQETSARNLLKTLSEEDEVLADEIQGLNRERARHQQELQVLRDYAACLAAGTA